MPRNNKKGTRVNWRTITLDIHVIPDRHASLREIEDAIDIMEARCRQEIVSTIQEFGFRYRGIKKFHNMKGCTND